MSLAQRFERRLESVVGSAFARVFKGQVEPVEIATALQREATDKRNVMGTGEVLAPNRYRVTLSPSDYERSSLGGSAHQLAGRAGTGAPGPERLAHHRGHRGLSRSGRGPAHRCIRRGVPHGVRRAAASAALDSLSLPAVPGLQPVSTHPRASPGRRWVDRRPAAGPGRACRRPECRPGDAARKAPGPQMGGPNVAQQPAPGPYRPAPGAAPARRGGRNRRQH